MASPRSRYVVRVLGIPTSLTKSAFESELTKNQVQYEKVFFAAKSNEGWSAGFAFVEFSTEDDMHVFMERYPLTEDGKDVLWPAKVDKI